MRFDTVKRWRRTAIAVLLLAIPHTVHAQQLGFTTAIGGDTRAPYASPNLGPINLNLTYFEITREGLSTEPIMALKKVNGSTTTDRQNASLAVLGEKWTNAPATRLQGIFSEVVDYSGWNGVGGNNFVEGIRSHGLVAGANGSGYGLIGFAGGVPSVWWKYLIGIEGEVANNTTNAPSPMYFSRERFAASFVATSQGSAKPDAALVVNGYSASKFMSGILIGQGSVEHTAFANMADTAVGIDLSLGSQSWAAISMDRNTPIRVEGKNILAVSAGGNLLLGAEAEGVFLGIDGVLKEVTLGPPDSGGEGFRALIVPN